MGKSKNNGGSFVKMAAILASAGLIVRFIGFLYRLPLTNMIGDEGNGFYAAGYNIYNFFLIMSSAGLPVAISKMIAEKTAVKEYRNAKKIFNVSMVVAGGLSFLCGLLMLVGARIFQVHYMPMAEAKLLNENLNLWYNSVWCIYTLAPTIFIVGIMAVFRGYFQGLQTTVPTALSQIIEQILNAVFSVYLAWVLIDFGIEFAAAGGTAGTGIGALAGLVLLVGVYFATRKTRNAEFSLDKGGYKTDGFLKITKNLLKIALPIIAGTAIFSMTNLVDTFMVNDRLVAAGFDGAAAIKLYGQLNGKYVTLSTMPVAISTAIATAVVPSIAASVVKKEKALVQSKIDVALRITMMISIPAAAGLGVLGVQILKMLFPRYSDGGILIQVGSFSVIFLALSQISTGVLQGIGKVKTPAFNAVWGALVKIPVNYFLIAVPEINVIGAVISTTVCYMVCSLLNFRALVKTTGVKPDYVGMLLKPGVSAVVMAVAAIYGYKGVYALVSNNTFATIIAIIFALIVYVIAMVAVKGFYRDDLIMVPAGSKMIRFLEKINKI